MSEAYSGRPGQIWSYRPGLEPAAFPLTGWGCRGYDEVSVDGFVEQVIKDRSAADAQISDLRNEVDRLHRYIRRQWAAVAAAESAGAPSGGRIAEPGGLVSPAAQARAVLNQAQEIAERRLAQADTRLSDVERQATERLERADREVESKMVDADQQVSRLIGAGEEEAARRLTRVDAIAEQVLIEAREDAANRRVQAQGDADRVLLLARTRYEDIVVRAHQRADRAAEVVLAEIEQPSGTAAAGGRARVELEMKAAYLRTFAKVSRAALQTALDVTAREFDRLLGASASREATSLPDAVLHDSVPVITRRPAHAADPVDRMNRMNRVDRVDPSALPEPARLIVLPDTDEAAERATVAGASGTEPSPQTETQSRPAAFSQR